MSVVIAQKRNPLEGPAAMIADAFARSQSMQFNAMLQKKQMEDAEAARSKRMQFEATMQDKQMQHQKDLNKTLDEQRQAQIENINAQTRLHHKELEYADRMYLLKEQAAQNENFDKYLKMLNTTANGYAAMQDNEAYSDDERARFGATAAAFQKLYAETSAGRIVDMQTFEADINEGTALRLRARSDAKFRDSITQEVKTRPGVDVGIPDKEKHLDFALGLLAGIDVDQGIGLSAAQRDLGRFYADRPNATLKMFSDIKVPIEGAIDRFIVSGTKKGSVNMSLEELIKQVPLHVLLSDNSVVENVNKQLDLYGLRADSMGFISSFRTLMNKHLNRNPFVDTRFSGTNQISSSVDPEDLKNLVTQ